MNKRNKILHRYIHRHGKRYSVTRTINGKTTVYKSFYNIDEAIKYRDLLIENNWEPLPLTPAEKLEKETREYYKRIRRTDNNRYEVKNTHGEYMGYVGSVEEALYYRSLYKDKPLDKVPKPSEIDLKTNNPYIKDGLKYPLPERLKPIPKKKKISGSIVKKSEFSYHIHHGGTRNGRKSYVCACRTYEQAYYVRKEMDKCNWDLDELQRILDEYPVWYTWLMEFYRYININYDHYTRTGEIRYDINIPKEYLEEGQVIGHYHNYTHLEDALYERDYLAEHDWDYNELVYGIDDTLNPYYNMDLPPYPQRKLTNISEHNYHEQELTRAYELITEDPSLNQKRVCEKLGVTTVTFRNWLNKSWNTNFKEFKKIILNGENPINILEKVPHIHTPDLSRPKPPNFKGYITFDKRGKINPYCIKRDDKSYGSYPSKEIARKVVKELEKVEWDREKLPSIRSKYGLKTRPACNNIYRDSNKSGWSIRKEINGERNTYGHYKDYELAVIMRSLLDYHNWNHDLYPVLREKAENIKNLIHIFKSNMFGGVYDPRVLEQLSVMEDLEDNSRHVHYDKRKGKYVVSRSVKGKNQFYCAYKNRDEALLARDILLTNDWNKESLELVGELYGK